MMPVLASSRRRAASAGPRVAAALLCIVPIALAGCGESTSEKAAKNVCSATNEITSQLSKLEALPISTNFPSEAKTSVEAISGSIKKIGESASDLPSERRAEINAANQAFGREIAVITKDVVTATTSSNLQAGLKAAEPQIKKALDTLRAGYEKAFEALKCS